MEFLLIVKGLIIVGIRKDLGYFDFSLLDQVVAEI